MTDSSLPARVGRNDDTEPVRRPLEESSLPTRVVLAVGPVVFAALFLLRGVRPVVDPVILAIGLALAVITGFLLAGRRWAAFAELAYVVALFVSPAGRSFSFDLAGIDSAAWQMHAVAGLLSLGLAAGTAIVVLADRWSGRDVLLAASGGLLIGAGLIMAIQALEPTPRHGTDHSADEIAALPEIRLLDYGYGFEPPRAADGGPYRARLTSDTDVPHTFTIDELDIDVYVPARRWAVVEISGEPLRRAQPLQIICTIGDHLDLGMTATMTASAL